MKGDVFELKGDEFVSTGEFIDLHPEALTDAQRAFLEECAGQVACIDVDADDVEIDRA